MQSSTVPYPASSEPAERLLSFDESPQPSSQSVSSHLQAHHLEVDDKVKNAEEQLRALQEKRERLEQEKLELEEMSARQRKFSEGKAEVMKVLTETIPSLEEEANSAERPG